MDAIWTHMASHVKKIPNGWIKLLGGGAAQIICFGSLVELGLEVSVFNFEGNYHHGSVFIAIGR